MIDTYKNLTASELHAVVERLAAETDEADSLHAEATSRLQFQLFLVERANVQTVLGAMPPDEDLLRQRREILASIQMENERLESIVSQNSRERIIAEQKLLDLRSSDAKQQFTN
ncbi:hypothetical protein [Rhodopirellula bahusiensis]|uniref:hypothetical protein n=1 Tax=Rhodopirellula bahusiensis TaxID=2014065 RepID=UPI0032675487